MQCKSNTHAVRQPDLYPIYLLLRLINGVEREVAIHRLCASGGEEVCGQDKWVVVAIVGCPADELHTFAGCCLGSRQAEEFALIVALLLEEFAISHPTDGVGFGGCYGRDNQDFHIACDSGNGEDMVGVGEVGAHGECSAAHSNIKVVGGGDDIAVGRRDGQGEGFALLDGAALGGDGAVLISDLVVPCGGIGVFDVGERDDAVGLGDIGEGLARDGRGGLAGCAGEGVAGLPDFGLAARCGDDGVARAVGGVVGLVAVPNRLAVVDVPDEESVPREVGVPARLLTVLNVVVDARGGSRLEGVGRVELVGDMGVGSRSWNGQGALCVADVFGRLPTEEILLVYAVVGRIVAVAIVRTVVHNVPFAWGPPVIGVGSVAGVVVVGQTEDVAELVAERADAVAFARRTVEFAGASVVVDVEPVYFALRLGVGAVFIVDSRLDVPVVRPDGVGATAVGFALAGIDDIDEIDISVVVIVVLGEVHTELRVSEFAGFDNHVARVHIVAFAIVFAVVGVVLGEGYGADHVEGGCVGSVGLVDEVLARRAVSPVVGVGVGVHHLVHLRLCVGGLVLGVLEIDEDEQSAGCEVDTSDLVRTALPFGRCLAACSDGLRGGLVFDHLPVAIGVLADDVACAVGVKMVELVTVETHLDGGAVGLGLGLPAAVGGDCKYGCGRQEECP
mgnify:CR=1 FL=1